MIRNPLSSKAQSQQGEVQQQFNLNLQLAAAVTFLMNQFHVRVVFTLIVAESVLPLYGGQAQSAVK